VTSGGTSYPFGTIQAFGSLLVSHYSVPFEVASLLLVGAMVGAVILSRRSWS
jgi:NADH:ubiquinone oxidoreductase subunit 6 (subunit J)